MDIVITKLPSAYGSYNPKTQVIKINPKLLDKKCARAWVMSTLAHEYVHHLCGHNRKNVAEYEYLAQKTATLVLCTQYKENKEHPLFKKNYKSLEKWAKLMPRGYHYQLDGKAMALRNKIILNKEFWDDLEKVILVVEQG